jgi:NADH-quinone oxidoreductase subunit A
MLGNFLPNEYLPLLIFILLAIALGFGLLLVGEVIRPRRPYREKLMPYESGSTFETATTPLVEPTRYRFSVRFYIIAMLFVVFDVEAIFIYPWAIVFDKIGMFAFIEMVIFIVVLLIGFVYAWKKEAFTWD